MSAVFEAIGDVFEAVGDAVGDVVEGVFDVVETVMEEVVEPVMDTVSKVVESALDDPIGTIAKVATAVYAPYLLPLTNAAVTLANGGDLGDALESAAISFVAQGVGQYAGQFGDQLGASLEYGTDLGSAQTAMLAAQDAGMGTIGDIAGNVIGRTAAGAVRGQDPLDALISGSISQATNLLTQEIPGFSELPKSVQQSVNAAVSSTLQGGDPTNALINAALNAGIAAAKNSEGGGSGEEAEAGAGAAAEEEGGNQDVVTDSGITNRQYDEFTGMPTDDGLASLTTETSDTLGEDGLASLIDNGDGTFSRKFDDGSEIIEDASGNFIRVKEATEVAFEDQVEGVENESSKDKETLEEKTLEEKTQDEMTPEDWAAMYAIPTTDPETGETIVGADPSDYNVQDLGFDEKIDFGAYDNPNLGWTTNEDGSLTYVYDDGSTITANEDGSILGVTESTDTPYTPGINPVEKATESTGSTGSTESSNVNWDLVGALVGGAAIGGGRRGSRGGGGGGGGYGGSGDADNAGEEGQDGSDASRGLRFDWNQQGVNSLVNGAAYGQKFFDPRFEEIPAATGGLMSLAAGGPARPQYNLGSYSDGGRLLRGPGDGMSDNIPASIANKQPARLADGEFVIPADVVSHLGNGSTDAGSKVLYAMMEKVRRARTGNAKQGKKINPNKFVPR
jgi:hypothetical protein